VVGNQYSDILLVKGNAAGVTYVDVSSVRVPGGSGANTDVILRNGTTEPFEGISIVQVAGASTANAFQLPNGIVTSGAFAYKLYAFAPGESLLNQNQLGTGNNQFWDYRLGSAFAHKNGLSWRLQVAPQVAAYLSAPAGMYYANQSSIEDLHKRLGEVRHNTGFGDPDENYYEFFVRFIASDMEYESNLGFSDYGYDFDMKSHSIQLGGNLLKVKTDNDDTIRLGLAWTHGWSDITPDGRYDGHSETDMQTDTVSLYSTWQKENGFYIDGVLSYTKSKADVYTSVFADVGALKSRGWSASVESGYPFIFDNGLHLEPQAQLIYSNTSIDRLHDSTNALVTYDDADYLTGRLGLRASRTWEGEDGRKHTPYARANYYTTWGSDPTVNIKDAAGSGPGFDFKTGSIGDSLQLGLGWTSNINKEVSFYGEVDYGMKLEGFGVEGWRWNIGMKIEY